MTDTHTIRVVLYCGDRDDYNLINVIGPYPTPANRDRDLRRLANLPGVHGDAEFLPSNVTPERADHSCRPQQVADAADWDQVLAAVLGLNTATEDNPDVLAQAALPGL